MSRWARVIMTLIVGLYPSFAIADTYPSKTIRFIIGFAAGNSSDAISRLVIEDIRDRTGATIVVENRPGALGAIGLQAATSAAPDGYTLVTSVSATHSSGPYVLRALESLRPVENLTHVALLTYFDVGVVVASKSPLKTVQDIAAASNKGQDKIKSGYGTATYQIASASFALAAGIKATAVPYKAQTAAITDVLAGQVDFIASDVGSILSYVQSGALRPIAVLSEKRSKMLPDVPTAKELGLGDLFFRGFIGIDGPKGLPAEVTKWWTEQVKVSLAKPQIQEKIANIGMEAGPLFDAEFDKYLKNEQRRWADYSAKAGIQIE